MKVKTGRKVDAKVVLTALGLVGLFLCSVGYFVYGGFTGFLGTFLYTVSMGAVLFVSVVPFAGFVLQFIVGKYYVEAVVLSLTKMTPTLLTNVIFMAFLALGFIANISIDIYLVKKYAYKG